MYLGIFIKLVAGNIIDRENNLDAVLLGFFDEGSNFFCPGRVEKGVSNLRRGSVVSP